MPKFIGRLETRPRAPVPVGPFSGRRRPWRRLVSRLCATMDRVVGVTLLPIRIGAPPEIPLLRLTPPGEAR